MASPKSGDWNVVRNQSISEGRTFQAERQPVQRLGIRAKSAMYRTAQEPGWTGAVEGSEAGSWRG